MIPFQIIICVYCLVPSVYDRKLNICGLWTKQKFQGQYVELLETLIDLFHHFLTFYTPDN